MGLAWGLSHLSSLYTKLGLNLGAEALGSVMAGLGFLAFLLLLGLWFDLNVLFVCGMADGNSWHWRGRGLWGIGGLSFIPAAGSASWCGCVAGGIQLVFPDASQLGV